MKLVFGDPGSIAIRDGEHLKPIKHRRYRSWDIARNERGEATAMYWSGDYCSGCGKPWKECKSERAKAEGTPDER